MIRTVKIAILVFGLNYCREVMKDKKERHRLARIADAEWDNRNRNPEALEAVSYLASYTSNCYTLYRRPIRRKF